VPRPNPATAHPGPVHISRLGIHSATAGMCGYELAFRSDSGDLDAVTAAVALTFAETSLDTLAGTDLRMVTLTAPFLRGKVAMPFPPGQVVLALTRGAATEVPADLITRLADFGYSLCAPVLSPAEVHPLAAGINYVSTDAGALGLVEIVAATKARRLTSVVDGITNHRLLERARAAGADLLIGPAVSEPETVTSKPLPPSYLAVARLLTLLRGDEASVPVVEEVVKSDATMAYRLLRVANSAAYRSGQPVTTIRSAVMRIGLRNLQSWLMLILVSDAAGTAEDQLSSAVTRARACELLSGSYGAPAGEAFVVGLLSAVAPQLGRERVELAVEMHMDAVIVDALSGVPGPLTELLAAVEAYEAGQPVPAIGTTPLDVTPTWLEALGWSLEAIHTTSATETDAD
jgi:c-di-GMP-related signal transduction protein